MKNNRYIGKYMAFTLLLVFVNVVSVFAQVTKSKGTRITDNLTVAGSQLKETAILDLDSTTKGFFLPRMTTAQRDDLKSKMNAQDNGLAVYNIDIDCVEYWSERTNKWMSLCGSLPPATLDLADGPCSAKFINIVHNTNILDTWQQGKPFDSNGGQTLQIEVKVESVGTYQISASTDNGYFFSAEGQFQSIGNYVLQLKAMGTPINGYEQSGLKKGDKIKFNFNGKVSAACPDLELKIVPADLLFEIISVSAAKGSYKVFEQADKSKNTIEVDVNATTPGTAIITAYNVTLGVKFRGSKKLTGGPDKIILEPILGECAPNDNAAGTYELLLDTNVATANVGNKKSSITVLPTLIVGHGDLATFGTEPYYQGSAITAANTIELPIEVTNSGTSKLFLKGGGLEFESGKVELRIAKNSGDKQKVIFTAKAGTLPTQSSVVLKLSGDGAKFSVDATSKDVTLALGKKPVAYTIDCSKTKSNRAAIPYNKEVNKEYFITVTVNVTEKGEYEINTTGSADGVTFSSTENNVKKEFTKLGEQEVILYPVDGTKKPTNRDTYSMGIVSNDGSNAVGCTNYPVKVGFGDLKILYYTGDSRDGTRLPLFFNGLDGATGKKRFGPTGVILETGNVNVVTYRYTGKDAANVDNYDLVKRAAMAKRISDGEFNLIVIEGIDPARSFDKDMYDAMVGYIKKKNAMLLVSMALTNTPNNYVEGIKVVNSYSTQADYFGTYENLNSTQFYNEFNEGITVLTNSKSNLVNARAASSDDFSRKPYTFITATDDIRLQAQTNGSNAIKTTGSNLTALVTTSPAISADRAGAMRQKNRPKQVWVLGTYTNNTLGVFIHNNFSTTGEPVKGGYQGNSDNFGVFLANVLVNISKIIVNE